MSALTIEYLEKRAVPASVSAIGPLAGQNAMPTTEQSAAFPSANPTAPTLQTDPFVSVNPSPNAFYNVLTQSAPFYNNLLATNIAPLVFPQTSQPAFSITNNVFAGFNLNTSFVGLVSIYLGVP